MFNLENISKTYAKAHTKAVSDLTLTINNGEIFGFLGPNGAGKTTTIKLLTGILTPDEGSITVDGFSLKDDPINAKKQISFVPDTPETFSKLKASEYINFIADVYGVPTNERQKLIKEYAEMFHFNYTRLVVASEKRVMRHKVETFRFCL